MQHSATEQAAKAPLRDRLIPWYFVGAFAVVFVVNMFFVYNAVHTHRGLVTENPYEKGLAFDSIVETVREQKADAVKAASHERD